MSTAGMLRSVRVVTVNLWGDRLDVDARMRVIIDTLVSLKPHVVALQEVVGGNGKENQAATVAKALEAEWCFDKVNADGGAREAGNAIVSKFPIVAHRSIDLPSETVDPRRALMCHLKTPYGVLPFANAHLSWEMWHAERRERQVVALDGFVRALPGDLPPIIAGDFNTAPDSSAIMFLTGRMSLAGRSTYYRDCWQRKHPFDRGATWSTKNPNTVRWIERNRRLDFLFVGQMREDGWGAVLDTRIILDMPGPDGTYASDHFGVFAEIGQAPEAEAV